jgi:hypothetical protein
MRTRRSPRNQDRLWRELGQQGAQPQPVPYDWAPTLYDEVVKRGIPHADHYSDLYLPATEEVRILLLHYGHDRRGKHATATTFVNQVEGGTWYDVPFAYAPFWRDVARKAELCPDKK